MNGKRVLVTGGGSGAGADLALGFAKAGAKVVICGRRPNALASGCLLMRGLWTL